MTSTDQNRELRAWAYGDDAREAAAELLIRSGLAGVEEPWILWDQQWGICAVDFTTLSSGRSGLTSSQRAVLFLAASLATDALVDMRAVARDLDYDHLLLAATAITHAAGYHRASTGITGPRKDGDVPRIVRRPPVLSWDDLDISE